MIWIDSARAFNFIDEHLDQYDEHLLPFGLLENTVHFVFIFEINCLLISGVNS